jgi:hypothetical protein
MSKHSNRQEIREKASDGKKGVALKGRHERQVNPASVLVADGVRLAELDGERRDVRRFRLRADMHELNHATEYLMGAAE